MWNSIPKIATPIALVAFALGVALTIVRAYMRRRAELIKLAPLEDRGRLIDEAISDYGIRADNLTRDQRYQLVLKGLESRGKRFQTSALVLVVLALLLALLIVVAMFATHGQNPSAGATPTPSLVRSGVTSAFSQKEPADYLSVVALGHGTMQFWFDWELTTINVPYIHSTRLTDGQGNEVQAGAGATTVTPDTARWTTHSAKFDLAKIKGAPGLWTLEDRFGRAVARQQIRVNPQPTGSQ